MAPRAARRPNAGAGRTLAAAAGGIAVLTVLARIAGFGRTAVLAGVAGRTCVADAYLTANQLPNVVFEVVAGGALAATVVPLVGRALLARTAAGQESRPSAAPAAPPLGHGLGRGAVVADDGVSDEAAASGAVPGWVGSSAAVSSAAVSSPAAAGTGPDPGAEPDPGADPDPDVVATLSALLGWVLLLLVPAAALCALAAPVIARALVGSGCAGESTLVARMLVFFAPQIPLYGLAVLASGLLQAAHRFTATAAAPLVSSGVVVAAYLLFAAALPASGIPGAAQVSSRALLALAGGTTAGVLALAATVATAARRLPVTRAVRPTLHFPPGVGRLAARLAGAGLAAVIAAQGAALLVTLVANHRGAPGTLAVYTYAGAVYLLPAAVLTTPVTTSVLPRVVAADPAAGMRLAAGSLGVVLLLSLAGGAVLFATAPEVGRVLDAGPGAGAGAGAVGTALSWFAPGVPGLAVTTHLARLTTALRHPGAAAVLGSCGWALAAAGTVLVGWEVGAPRLAGGLAAATAAGLIGGGALAVLGWAGLTGRDGLRSAGGAVLLGVPAVIVGAAAGRVLGTAVLGAASAGPLAGGSAAREVVAALVAALVSLVVAALAMIGGSRLSGRHLPWPPAAAR